MTQRTLFIGDTHFNHKRIHEKFRTQFSSDDEHDNFIHNNIIEAADTNTSLWLMGDTFFNPSGFWRLEAFRQKYQQVNIVLGNHCHNQLPRYALQFKNVNVYGVQQRYGLWLSHVPVPDYELYRGNCIHGHMHSKGIGHFKEWGNDGYALLPHEQPFIQDARYFCVSCENVNYKPISLNTIKEIRGWK